MGQMIVDLPRYNGGKMAMSSARTTRLFQVRLLEKPVSHTCLPGWEPQAKKGLAILKILHVAILSLPTTKS